MTDQSDALGAIYNSDLIAGLGTSGQPTELQFADIANAGYDVVINLALPTSDNAIANEGSIVAGHGMTYIHIPVVFEDPAIADLKVFFGVMNALEGKKIWVHCAMNLRVSAFVFLYLRYCRDFDDEAAETWVLKKWRPRMDDVWAGFLTLPRDTILSED